MFFAIEPIRGLFQDRLTEGGKPLYHLVAAPMGDQGVTAFCNVWARCDDVRPLAEIEGGEGIDYEICPRCKAAALLGHVEAPNPIMLIDLLVLQTEYGKKAQGLRGDREFEAQWEALRAEIALLRQQAALIYSRYRLEGEPHG